MEVVIASERASSTPLKVLALLAGGVAAMAVVLAAGILLLRWGSGAFDARSAGGTLALAASGLVMAAAVVAIARPLWPRVAIANGLSRISTRPPASEPATPYEASFKTPASLATAVSALPWPDARLVQRIERYERQGADGSVIEAAIGRVVVRFSEGTRSAVAHVGFCPPFSATPRVAVSNECDGLEVDVVAPEVLPWGVRIECRLEEPSDEPLDVEVNLVAEPAEPR